jgi:hypothetical protein
MSTAATPAAIPLALLQAMYSLGYMGNLRAHEFEEAFRARWPQSKSEDPFRDLHGHARNWNWAQSGGFARMIFAAAGLPHPYETDRDAGYAIHCGTHPIQQGDDE